MNVKSHLTDYRVCIGIYIISILLFVFAMFTDENFAHYQNEVIFISLAAILGLIALFYAHKHEMELHKVALIIILIFGLLLIFFTPPFSFIDESAHFTRAELISEGSLYPETTDKGIYVNDYYFPFQESYYGVTILSENNYNNPITDHKNYWLMTTKTPFYSYLLSGFGILIAKLLNLTAIWALYFSRIANLIFYGATACFMIKIVPKFKLHLLVFSTIPLCISQASYSTYDAFIVTFTLIILTYFIKMYLGEVNAKNLAIFFISVLLISMIKQPYVLIALLILAIPFKDNKLKKYSIIATVVTFILAILSIGPVLSIFISTTAANNSGGVITNISMIGQARFIASNPAIILTLIKDMIVSIPNLFLLKSNFFHYTGYKGIKLINLISILFFILFSLFYKLDINLKKKERGIVALICIMVYAGINVIFYLIGTPMKSQVILGVQSRYFLPVICMLPLIINTKYKIIENKEIYIFTIIIICLTGLFMLPITHFY